MNTLAQQKNFKNKFSLTNCSSAYIILLFIPILNFFILKELCTPLILRCIQQLHEIYITTELQDMNAKVRREMKLLDT